MKDKQNNERTKEKTREKIKEQRDEFIGFKKCKRLAIMGGTFDPIHYGHLVTAEAVRHEYNVEHVIFIPTGKSPHKSEGLVSHSEHRYLMTVLATVNNADFGVSRIEIDREGKSYTIDTINSLRQICGENTKIYFITGADAVNQILTWKNADDLLTLCSFIAVTRPGYNKDKLYEQVVKIKEQYRSRIHFLEVPALAISSSDIRERIKCGKPVKYLLPEEVEKYIKKFGLYNNNLNKCCSKEINKKLRKHLSDKRYIHTQGVADEAVKLAIHYGANRDSAMTAALLHDIAKCQSNDELLKYCNKHGIEIDSIMQKRPELLHCIVGAEIAKNDYDISDSDILNAIRYHTTGRKNMSLLEKIIYIADFIEPNRSLFPMLDEVRAMAYIDLDKALALTLKSTIQYNREKNADIHPWSIEALEYVDSLHN